MRSLWAGPVWAAEPIPHLLVPVPLGSVFLSTQPEATSASHFLPLGPPISLSSWHTGPWLTTQPPCQSHRDWEPPRLLTGSLNNPLLIRSGGICHPQASSFTCGHFLS